MSIAAAILLGLSVLLWLPLAANAATIHRSDPAGRGLAVAYGAVNAGVWLLAMGSFFVVSACSGGMPLWFVICVAVLTPAACASSLATLTLLGRCPWMRLAAATPVVAPGLLLGLAAWGRWWRPVNTSAAAGEVVLIVLVAVLCLLPWSGHWFAPFLRPRPAHADEPDAASSASGESA